VTYSILIVETSKLLYKLKITKKKIVAFVKSLVLILILLKTVDIIMIIVDTITLFGYFFWLILLFAKYKNKIQFQITLSMKLPKFVMNIFMLTFCGSY